MAIPLRYEKQLPWVGTQAHHDFLTEVSRQTGTSKAHLIRDIVNAFAGLVPQGGLDEGQPPEGMTMDEVVNATIDALYPGRKQYRQASAEDSVPA